MEGLLRAVVTAPPLAESVAPAFRFHPPSETWGDGMDWEDMDHVTRLKFLTPRVIETGRPDRLDIGFFDCLPKAVENPLSAKREAQMQTERDSAVEVIKAFFKRKEQADEQGKDESDEDDSSDGYPSSNEGVGLTTKTFRWNGKLTEEETVALVNMLPSQPFNVHSKF